MRKARRKTALDRLTAQIRTALRRNTKNIIEIGKLLIESREHLDHGEWQPWLAENFDLSYDTALNYVSAAEYVARKSKNGTVPDFDNLSVTMLYWLAAGQHYNEQEEAAILAATRERRVDKHAAETICDALAPDNDTDAEDTQEAGGDDGAETAAEEDAEIKAILDGPPPAVPPPAPNQSPPDFTLRAFDEAIGALKRLMTKSSAQFVRTVHGTDDLENVESFIRNVRVSTAATQPCTDQNDNAVRARTRSLGGAT
jgi:hypothetical protein